MLCMWIYLEAIAAYMCPGDTGGKPSSCYRSCNSFPTPSSSARSVTKRPTTSASDLGSEVAQAS